jgi:hypothetical protein
LQGRITCRNEEAPEAFVKRGRTKFAAVGAQQFLGNYLLERTPALTTPAA